jgi:hypothetical protein
MPVCRKSGKSHGNHAGNRSSHQYLKPGFLFASFLNCWFAGLQLCNLKVRAGAPLRRNGDPVQTLKSSVTDRLIG